jgi:hypothetical protein
VINLGKYDNKRISQRRIRDLHASHMVATLCEFNHVLAFDTLAPQPLLCKILQLDIFWTGMRVPPLVLVAGHPIMPGHLTSDAKKPLHFTHFRNVAASAAVYFEKDCCNGCINSLRDIKAEHFG